MSQKASGIVGWFGPQPHFACAQQLGRSGGAEESDHFAPWTPNLAASSSFASVIVLQVISDQSDNSLGMITKRRQRTLIRRIDSKQMPGHPLGAHEVAIENPSSALNIIIWIDAQHDPRNFTPVGTLLGRIQHAQIGVDVFFVVSRDYRAHRGNVGQVRLDAALRAQGSPGEKVGQVGSNGTQYLHSGTRPTLHDEKPQPFFETRRYQV
jgi:hypothetical protein